MADLATSAPEKDHLSFAIRLFGSRRGFASSLLFSGCGLVACGVSTDTAGTDIQIGDTGDADGADAVVVPGSCEEAAANAASVGCDYWPTVLANGVLPMFDFAVVVTNAGAEPADVTVTGPAGVTVTETVAPSTHSTIYLPWVDALKQGITNTTCSGLPFASITVVQGAYHLVSTRPVSVFQFNPLEGKSTGGPPNKVWTNLCDGGISSCGDGQCPSHSNDASLLLPSTAMTGNYRVAGQTGQTDGSYVAITGTEDGTHVTVTVGPSAAVLAGTGVVATSAGGSLTLSLGAGDVAQLFAADGDDLSGSLVQADKPVQVMTGAPCLVAPIGAGFCDHVEESVVPVEALGKDYVVTRPTGPSGVPVGHIVRLYGHVDGTHLTYLPAAPAGAPATLDAGEVVELGQVVQSDFEVKGDRAFLVGTLMTSGMLADPALGRGDPSQSFVVAVEQFRDTYMFFTPADYDASFADVVAPEGTSLVLDGAPVSGVPTPIGTTGVVVYRLALTSGAHRLTSSHPVGVQVMGYSNATAYQYPAGSNYARIAPSPE